MRGMGRCFSTWVLLWAGCSAVACATTVQEGGNLRVKVVDATSDRPANVALHLIVDDKKGEPLVGLQPSNFRIFEDGKLVPEDKARRALLDPKAAEVHITMLLIDLSGPIVESPTFPELVKQVGEFAERLKPTHQLTVSLFDGRDELRTVLEPDEADIDKALGRMRRYRPEERKGNLNGAVVKALAILDKQTAESSASRKASNLIVFTDRGDVADKVPEEEVEVALDKTPADVYVIAVGPGIKRPELGKIARTDAFYSTQTGDLEIGFTHLSKHLEEGAAGHYLLSYCSPKRKGAHRVEIEIVTEKEHGKLTHKFSADGFVKGCTPSHLPAFVAQKKKDDDSGDDQGEARAPAKAKVAKRAPDKAAKNSDGDGDEGAAATEETPPKGGGGSGAVSASATTVARGKGKGKLDRKQEKSDEKGGKEE
jgi:hypothetical protein